jgi:hypothetical protein
MLFASYGRAVVPKHVLNVSRETAAMPRLTPNFP